MWLFHSKGSETPLHGHDIFQKKLLEPDQVNIHQYVSLSHLCFLSRGLVMTTLPPPPPQPLPPLYIYINPKTSVPTQSHTGHVSIPAEPIFSPHSNTTPTPKRLASSYAISVKGVAICIPAMILYDQIFMQIFALVAAKNIEVNRKPYVKTSCRCHKL